MICQICGYEMKHKDYVKRKLKHLDGDYEIVKIERQCCIECRKIKRVYPDYILPYKQYDKETIKFTLNNIDDILCEDYPSEQTVKNWIRKNNILYNEK